MLFAITIPVLFDSITIDIVLLNPWEESAVCLFNDFLIFF